MSSCGKTKGCYRNPKGCSELACDLAVTWKDHGENVEFELTADTDGWVAVGFSEDKKMVCNIARPLLSSLRSGLKQENGFTLIC